MTDFDSLLDSLTDSFVLGIPTLLSSITDAMVVAGSVAGTAFVLWLLTSSGPMAGRIRRGAANAIIPTFVVVGFGFIVLALWVDIGESFSGRVALALHTALAVFWCWLYLLLFLMIHAAVKSEIQPRPSLNQEGQPRHTS